MTSQAEATPDVSGPSGRTEHTPTTERCRCDDQTIAAMCRFHAAAPAMLEALERAEYWLDALPKMVSLLPETATDVLNARNIARAAMGKGDD